MNNTDKHKIQDHPGKSMSIKEFINSEYCHQQDGVTRLKQEYAYKASFNNELIIHLIFKEWEEELRIITEDRCGKLEFYSITCFWKCFTKIVILPNLKN